MELKEHRYLETAIVKSNTFNAKLSLRHTDDRNVYIYNSVFSIQGNSVALKVRKLIVKIRMWYADIRGHHGKRWDYEPSEHYFGRRKRK